MYLFAVNDVCLYSPAFYAAKSMKKALRETQTLRAKNFLPTAEPLPGGTGPPKFNQLERVTTFTYRSSLVKIYARNFELSW